MSHDATLPAWQQKLNEFCENWLYAFLVAMIIRHFALEAFQIPTASMEPMLYGDFAFLKRDQVVVDKLTPRFTGVNRWDVTVFQYPRPEVEHGGDGRPARSADGQRLDVPLLRPLFCRNFVKRAVVLPGDVFYISGGNLYLRQPDGTFACARKPESVQNAVWDAVYRHGDQEGYLPWSSGAAVRGEDLVLDIPTTGTVFTQPVRNLYFKPGPVRVAPLAVSEKDDHGGTTVEAAMTKPVFVLGGERGNVWDLDRWRLRRVTTRDLDSGNYGAVMNSHMDEFVADTRWRFQVVARSGTPALRLDLGSRHSAELRLGEGSWTLSVDGVQAGQGACSATPAIDFGRLDDRIDLRIDGQIAAQVDVAPCDATQHRPVWRWTGAGQVTLRGAVLERDLHYTNRGFLANERQDRLGAEAELRKNSLTALQADQMQDLVFRVGFVREQMRGSDQLTDAQRTDRWGYSPETAITAPIDGYLLLGDNSPFSLDSRMWGWVPEANLRGRALLVMFPPQRWRLIR
jgi:signal peptidase I